MESLSELLGYYDPIRRMCMDNQYTKVAVSISSEYYSSFSVYNFVEQHLTLIKIIIVLILVCLIILIYFWKKKKQLKNELKKFKINLGKDNGILSIPSIIDFERQNYRLPSISNIFFYMFITHLFCIILSFINSDHKDLSDIILIQVSSLSVLFPLVILILTVNSKGSYISKSLVILYYAYAFPASIILVNLSSSLLYVSSIEGVSVIVIVSLILIMLLLYRILKINFSEIIFDGEERKLIEKFISNQINYYSVLRNVRYLSIDFLAKKSKFIKPLEELYTNTRRYNYHEIGSSKEGVVKKIKVKPLIDALNIFSNSTGFAKKINISDNINFVNSKDLYANFIIYIKFLGDEISDKDGLLIAKIEFPKTDDSTGEDNSKLIGKNIVNLIRKSFKPDINQNHKLDISLENISNRLSEEIKKSVEQGYDEISDKIFELYLAIYKLIYEENKKVKEVILSLKFNLSTGYNLPGYNEINSIKRFGYSVNQIYNIFFKKSGINHQLLKNMVYIPFRISYEAFKNKDIDGFTLFTKIAISQSYMLSKYYKVMQKEPVAWLRSLACWYIIPDIETTNDDTKPNTLFLEQIVRIIQECIKVQIETLATEENLIFSMKYLQEATSIFKSDDVEMDICQLKLEANHNPILYNSKIMAKLDEKRKKMEEVESWYYKSILGLLGYSLQVLENKQPVKQNEQIAKFFIDKYLSVFSIDFYDLLKKYLTFNTFVEKDEWGWRNWEIPEIFNNYRSQTTYYIQKVFAILFYNIAGTIRNDESFKTTDINIPSTNNIKDELTNIRTMIKNIVISKENEFVKIQPNEAQLEKLFSFFDELIQLDEEKNALDIVVQVVSKEKYKIFKNEFYESFKDQAVIRNILKFKIQPKEKFIDWWGINVLEDRNIFVESPRVQIESTGKVYGEHIASQEDGFIFEQIIGSIKPKRICTDFIASSIDSLLSKQVKRSDIIIFINYPAYMIKLFKEKTTNRNSIKDKYNFVPAYLLKNKENKKLSGEFKYKKQNIPVYYIHTSPQKGKYFIVIFDKNVLNIEIGYLKKENQKLTGSFKGNEIGINIDYVDPKTDEDLKKKLLEANPEWLNQYSSKNKDKLVGMKVLVKIYEDINIVVSDKDRIIVAELSDECILKI